jgi:hypothetical protein
MSKLMTSTLDSFHLPLRAMMPERPTHFTASVLGPAAERALATVYSELEAPLPAPVVLWQNTDAVRLDRAVLAEADQALRRSLAASPGALGRLFGGGNRRAPALIAQTLADAPGQIARTEQWQQRVHAMEWRQATVLQVMEEIEPRAGEALLLQQRAASSLALTLALIQPLAPVDALADLAAGLNEDLPRAEYRLALRQLADAIGGDWPPRSATAQEWLNGFLADYGLWASEPLEAAEPRWVGDQARLFTLLPGLVDAAGTANPGEDGRRRAAAAARISRELGGNRRRQFDSLAMQLEQLAELQPRVQNALVTVVATARYWVQGAAGEAMADGRLQAADEVFLLELEELKQIMTGEWSSAAQVQPIVEARRQTGEILR